ncbi:hypothetical protein MTO96_038965 [Rhipicephalus appendiculatus]
MLQGASNRLVIVLLVFLGLSQANFKHVSAKPRQEVQDETVVTIDDIQRIGEANLDDATRSYIASGADREQTLKENTVAFSRLRFRPRTLVDVSRNSYWYYNGELGTAQAARDAGTVMIVSAMSTASMEDIRASAPDCLLWQQMYIFRNRSLTKSMIRRAEHQGFAAIVVTVDSPVTGQAVSLGKNMFVLPEGLRFANLEASSPGRSFTFDPSKEDFIGNLLSSSATWDDFRWLRTITTLPLVAKGVLTAESALAAFQNGASAVLVSNHGARQLDGDPATIEALPEVVAAVGDRMEIYLDGGVRSGADAVKAVSIGARAVFVGRPVLWGARLQRVDKVLDIFSSEFNRTIQLLGVPDANNLCTDFVVREPYYSQPLHRNCAPKQPWGDWVPIHGY